MHAAAVTCELAVTCDMGGATEPAHRGPACTCWHARAQADLQPWVFLSNAAAAFGLNMSVFLLIGKTSALTMNVAGVLKDWLLIGLSVAIFKAQVQQPLRRPPATQ